MNGNDFTPTAHHLSLFSLLCLLLGINLIRTLQRLVNILVERLGNLVVASFATLEVLLDIMRSPIITAIKVKPLIASTERANLLELITDPRIA